MQLKMTSTKRSQNRGFSTEILSRYELIEQMYASEQMLSQILYHWLRISHSEQLAIKTLVEI